MMNKIEMGRRLEGKETGHTYLIVNVDEPYSKEVIAIMRKNNHWEG